MVTQKQTVQKPGFLNIAYFCATTYKAFVLSFSEALWSEYGSRGIRVLALCPGATASAFNEVAGLDLPSFRKGAPAAYVAVAALKTLSQGLSYVVPGAKNYWSSLSSRFAPRAGGAKIGSRMMRPGASS
jgi:short-subunit dehydrogenase